jgi:hypothetical protein
MSRPTRKLNPLMFLPGTVIWILIGVGFATGEDLLIGLGVACAISAFLVLAIRKVRSSGRARLERRRIWNEGTEALARIITIGTDGGSFNDHPYVDFELDVNVSGRPTYRVSTRALISQLAIPRVQPGCDIAVRIDSAAPDELVVDAALTPYGY